ncbi:MAG TPA: hypothetical protein DD435_03410 [Cyanobacteria bacterium UBA8530]|nr:hypothetical protein [Cyanobacteria bacterium UBA8530]
MLVAYAISPEGVSEAEIRKLCRQWYSWNQERPAGIGKLRLKGDRRLLRGQTHVEETEGLGWLMERLRKLSEKFPLCPCYLSGGVFLGILKGGEFLLSEEKKALSA